MRLKGLALSAIAVGLALVALTGCGEGPVKTLDWQTTPTPDATTANPAPADTGGPAATPDAAGGLAAAQTACSTFAKSIAPVIQSSVHADDLAPLIRMQLGEPPGGGSIDPNAPFFNMTDAAVTAADDDPKYEPLHQAVENLGHDIIHADPGSDLSRLSTDAGAIDAACASSGAA